MLKQDSDMLSQSAIVLCRNFEGCDKVYMRPGDLDRCIRLYHAEESESKEIGSAVNLTTTYLENEADQRFL